MLRTAGRIQKYMKAANSLWPESLICWAFFFFLTAILAWEIANSCLLTEPLLTASWESPAETPVSWERFESLNFSRSLWFCYQDKLMKQ